MFVVEEVDFFHELLHPSMQLYWKGELIHSNEDQENHWSYFELCLWSTHVLHLILVIETTSKRKNNNIFKKFNFNFKGNWHFFLILQTITNITNITTNKLRIELLWLENIWLFKILFLENTHIIYGRDSFIWRMVGMNWTLALTCDWHFLNNFPYVQWD